MAFFIFLFFLKSEGGAVLSADIGINLPLVLGFTVKSLRFIQLYLGKKRTRPLRDGLLREESSDLKEFQQLN